MGLPFYHQLVCGVQIDLPFENNSDVGYDEYDDYYVYFYYSLPP